MQYFLLMGNSTLLVAAPPDVAMQKWQPVHPGTSQGLLVVSGGGGEGEETFIPFPHVRSQGP